MPDTFIFFCLFAWTVGVHRSGNFFINSYSEEVTICIVVCFYELSVQYLPVVERYLGFEMFTFIYFRYWIATCKKLIKAITTL